MAIRKFLTSVADVYGYDTQTDAIVFTSKTLLDSSIEVSLGSSPVRGGRGNQLQYIYYHTGEMKFTLTDTQWNLGLLGSTAGSDVNTSTSTYQEASVALTSTTGGQLAAGVVPLVFETGDELYGWATKSDGSATYRVKFTDNTTYYSFATLSADGSPVLGAISDKVCVRYYAATPAATYVTIEANMVPKVVKLVMEAQLNSADVTTNKIGIVQIIAPTAQLSGAFTVAMKSDGVSNTPLTATALAYTPAGSPADACVTDPYYAKIIEIIDAAEWYDGVIGLSVVGGDFAMDASTTSTLNVWAIPASGAAFQAPNEDLDFAITSGPSGTVVYTAGSTGVNYGMISAGATTGTAVITACISANTAIDTTVTVTIETA